MVRDLCVPECSGDACCDGVTCPEGTACADGLGRCGNVSGLNPTCVDLALSWYTARDVPTQPPAAPTPVTFEVRNQGATPLYFRGGGAGLKFELLQRRCDEERLLEAPENQTCACRCPDTGPFNCPVCAIVLLGRRIRAGASFAVTWSGTEAPYLTRACSGDIQQTCVVRQDTLPGSYSFEVCAYAAYEGGNPTEDDPDVIFGGSPSGDPDCRMVTFDYPATTPVVIAFGEGPPPPPPIDY
jgi:hypothetical protein